MSYIKTNWKSGDVVTSEKLNKIENGIVSANKGLPFVVANVVTDLKNGIETLNITPNDIFDVDDNVMALCAKMYNFNDVSEIHFCNLMVVNKKTNPFSYYIYTDDDIEYAAESKSSYFYTNLDVAPPDDSPNV